MGRVYTKRHLPLQDISMSIPAGQVNGEVILLIPGLRVGPVFSQHAHHIRGASDSCPKKRRVAPLNIERRMGAGGWGTELDLYTFPTMLFCIT